MNIFEFAKDYPNTDYTGAKLMPQHNLWQKSVSLKKRNPNKGFFFVL